MTPRLEGSLRERWRTRLLCVYGQLYRDPCWLLVIIRCMWKASVSCKMNRCEGWPENYMLGRRKWEKLAARETSHLVAGFIRDFNYLRDPFQPAYFQTFRHFQRWQTVSEFYTFLIFFYWGSGTPGSAFWIQIILEVYVFRRNSCILYQASGDGKAFSLLMSNVLWIRCAGMGELWDISSCIWCKRVCVYCNIAIRGIGPSLR